ncbi:MAG: hypothetical protein Q9163_006353 [Psora crenata]
MPAHNPDNDPYRSISRAPHTPRSSRRTSPARQTLPPISDLLNGNLPLRYEAPEPPSTHDRGRSDSYPSAGSQSAGAPVNGRHGDPHRCGQRRLSSPDRSGNRGGLYLNNQLPMRSGPPREQHGPPPSSLPGWSTPSSSVGAAYSHSLPPPPQRSLTGSTYAPSGRQSPYDPCEREGCSSLPPPPPPYPGSNGYRPGDHPSTRMYSDREGHYGHSSYSEETVRSSHNYSVPPPPGSRYRAPTPYGNSFQADSAHPHAHPPSPEYHHSASDRHSSRSSAPSHEPMEERPTRRRRGNLPKWATDYLKQWFFEHVAHPYPTEQEKQELCKITGLGMTQLSNWFINARRRQTPALNAQAQAENMIRENSGQSRSKSDSDGRSHDHDALRRENNKVYPASNP